MKRVGLAAVALALVAGTLIWFWRGGNPPEPPPPATTEKIVLAVENGLLGGPVWVAEKKGYFRMQGLDVQLIPMDSGRTALRTMLEKGGIDMVDVAQTPVMFNSFVHSDYAIVTGFVTATDDTKVVARRDAGIAEVADLKGKRIGITKGSTGHYFLGALLNVHGMYLADVTAVDIKADELPQALADGKVAAISSWEPHGGQARKLLGDKSVPLESKGLFRQDVYFVAQKRFIAQHPEALTRFLRAIDQAIRDMNANPQEAIAIASQRVHADRELAAALWPSYDFKLFLDQAIVTSLENQARWAIDSGLTDAKAMPNYLDFIHVDALQALNPAAVTLIH